jgi:O-antigen ligase/tetratricopeptide (TPR) repeat protein
MGFKGVRTLVFQFRFRCFTLYAHIDGDNSRQAFWNSLSEIYRQSPQPTLSRSRTRDQGKIGVLGMKDRISELLLVLLVCLAPWAYGSVEAWAELWLYVGIALLTVLNHRRLSVWNRRGRLLRVPGLALLGLVLLALFQTVPFQRGVLSWIAPSLAADRAQLLPDRPEHVLGDTDSAVGFPATTLSLEPDSTLQTAVRLSAAWLLFQAVLGLKSTPGVSVRFARVVVLNAALLALFAIVQGLTWNGRIYWVRPAHASMNSWSAGGPFLNHSHLAAYLNMGLGLALGLLLQGSGRDFLRRGSAKPWIAFAAAIIAVGVIGSHSRSGFLGLLTASVFFACFLRRRLITLGFGLVVVLAISGLCLALLGGSSNFGSRLASILDVGNEGYLTRLEIWRGALRAWWARPCWGSGFGVFPVAIIPFLRHSNKWVFFARAENEYIDLLVEGGAIGFVLALTFLAGIGVLGRRTIRHLSGEQKRGLVEGAAFGLIALSVQSCADFAPHVPAVGILAVVLCGLIARQARFVGMGPEEQASQPSTTRWLSTKLRWLVPVALSVFLVSHAVRDAWIENRLDRAGLPTPGTYMTTVGTLETATGLHQSRDVPRIGILTDAATFEPATRGLDEYRMALDDVLRRRPNWSEGYLRLGLAHLGLYRKMTKEWLDHSGVGRDQINRMAEPLWLLGTVHEQPEKATTAPRKLDVLSVEPVKSHLVPAAHCFLEARRCSPFLALPHAELAALDYLLARGDSASTYATRAMTLSGNDGLSLTYLAHIAMQAGDRKLAAQCWRIALEVNPSRWADIADAARMVLSSDEILTEVATDGGDAIRFADRLYPKAHERTVRNRFLEVAIERFAVSREVITADQLFLEAHALASLNQSVRAGKQMESALALKPSQAAWREEYIEWLLRWGRADEAHAQALKGQYFSPESKAIREAVDRTAQVLARGNSTP